MSKILNFFSIIGLLGFCITLWIDNKKNGVDISAQTIAVILVGVVFIYARKRILSSVLKITVSVFGLAYTLAKLNVYTIAEGIQLAGYLFALLLALFGFYVMFGGLNKNNDEAHFTINRKTGKLKRRWL